MHAIEPWQPHRVAQLAHVHTNRIWQLEARARNRGNILLTLKQSGHAVDKSIRDIIWD